MSPLRARTKEPDQACAQAVDLAHSAAVEVAGDGQVGEHLGATAEGDRVVTHLFGCLDPAYHGWCWAVTVARASRARNVTVDECVLIPGPDAILAPDWVPWLDRLQPGDLGVGDILPAPPDDPRLVPALLIDGDDGLANWGEAAWVLPVAEADAGADENVADLTDEAADAGAWPGDEVPQEAAAGLPADARPEAGGGPDADEDEPPGPDLQPVPGRARVLSAIGRDDAAFRWYTSEHGPKTPLAHAAPGVCAGCGFFVRLGGPLGQVFGVCANSYAPDDGRVVSVDHGCGAHSESVFAPVADQSLRPVIDELGYDLVDTPGISVDETVFESLEHN